MGLFLVWRHKLICIILSLCKHACKEVCDVKQGVDPYPLLARSCDRWWPDFLTFTACKRLIFGLKRSKKAQCVSNRCKDLRKKKIFWDYGHFKSTSKKRSQEWSQTTGFNQRIITAPHKSIAYPQRGRPEHSHLFGRFSSEGVWPSWQSP